ncbi:MAG: hypothetical protein DWQ19_08815 [Crenarchaeota archaeon]|mgnify:CR=1 FL=1|nr:MAG: hypothetical protein DWQ19_08815 [Thermoproteota archaeon]
MRKQEAQKLQNRDEVEVRIDTTWEPGYVLGNPTEVSGRVIIPVWSNCGGYAELDHTDVR